MPSRTVLGIVVLLALGALAGLVPGSLGLAGLVMGKAFPEQAAPTAPGPDVSEDEKAIRAADEAYAVAYNKGDSKALAALFAEDAEVIESDGRRYQGRDLVEKAFAETFGAEKGVKIAVEIESIRFLTKDVAREEGRSVANPARGASVSRLYTVLYVKKDGRWLISSVREEDDPQVAPRDRLKELDWMVGDWVDEGSDSEVRVQCKRSEDGNFLIRFYSIVEAGKPVMTVTQRVGWDPVARRFRSWEFDSEGGFGEGRWSRAGDGWVIKHTGVRPEGTTASATNTTIRVRPDLIRWASTERVIGDESIPGEESHVLVRVPPAPRLVPDVPTPATPRNPR